MIIKIHILPDVPKSKGNQAMKLVRWKYTAWEIFLFKNYAESEWGRL